MVDVSAFVLAIGAVLIGLGLLLGWVNYKIDKLKEADKLNIETIGSIIVLEKAVKKLNEALRTESRSLSDTKLRLRTLERRIDILESGHPDSEFDYATTDDDGNALEVWFNGKKYIPEDKRDEDPIVIYADNKVMTETTRPNIRCCATCQHYRPGVNHTCDMNPLKWVSSKNVACNKYEAVKGEVGYIRYDRMYRNTEELLKRVEDLNYFYNVGLMSMATYRNMMDEWRQNDT